MAVLSINQQTSNVVSSAGVPQTVNGGEAIGRMVPVRLDTDNKWYISKATTSVGSQVHGIAITECSGNDSKFVVLVFDQSTPTFLFLGSGVLSHGVDYVVGASGGIVPKSDLTSLQFITDVGRAVSTSVLKARPTWTGATVIGSGSGGTDGPLTPFYE